MLERAEHVIPIGSQTFSKSKIVYPEGKSPLFIERGNGGRVWDVDGNEYVDLVNGLLPVVLGYRDPDVDNAIRNQLDSGITFSLPSSLETELAERLVEIIPSAEMVRFGKNGTDATSAAIRLARSFTGRDRIIALGYHGWQDWYIGATTRNKGVPHSIGKLTHKLPYNDIDAIKLVIDKYPNEIAAIILEPMSTQEPNEGYLEELRDITKEIGALLIFDEVITGFRFSMGGAQQIFGVTPDLSTFGKAMGNGMPISAVVGRTDVMSEMEEVFYSGTFGGETLSLAAAIAVIDKMKREPVIDSLWAKGGYLSRKVSKLIEEKKLSNMIGLSGKAPWITLNFYDHANGEGAATKTLYMIEMLKKGVLTIGTHNISYAHNEADINHIISAYDTTLSVIAAALSTGSIEDTLDCPILRPVFSVREHIKRQ